MTEWAKPKRGEHLFVVLRHDGRVDDIEQAVVATKAYRQPERAEAEAERMNSLNAGKGSRYFVVVARLKAEDEASS